MIFRPIIPIWLMTILAVMILLCKRKGIFAFLRQIIIVALLFAINLRPMIPEEPVTAEKKVMDDGRQKYVIPPDPVVEQKVLGIDSNLAKMSIRSIAFNGVLAVVKTRPGFANAVAYDIDTRGDEVVLGTIAGDDTILVIPREGISREEMERSLNADR